MDISRLRPIVGKIRTSVLGGESCADAMSQHPSCFLQCISRWCASVRASGTLDNIFEVLANERAATNCFAENSRMRWAIPAFVLAAAMCVLSFFLLFVLPQFATVLRDFGAKLDPIVEFFLGLSDLVRSQGDLILVLLAVGLAVGWLMLRRAMFGPP